MDTVKLIFNALLGLVLFAGILYLAYVCTKYVGKRYQTGGRKSRNLKIIENVPIGKDSSVAVVKAGEKYLLVGVTQHGISKLSDLEKDELILEEDNEQTAVTMPFSDALKKTFAEKFGKTDKKVQEDKTDEKDHIN